MMNMIKKTLGKTMLIIACLGVQGLTHATPQPYDALLTLLKKPPATYVMRDEDYKLDPKLLKDEYLVDWAIRPQFDFSPQELKNYKQTLSVEMTVIAASGTIVQSQVVKSSGSKKIDEKVVKSLRYARLESIPFMDPNVTYKLTQNFTMTSPL